MTVVNTVLLVVGVIVVLIGVAAFFIPAFARLINAPGGPKAKAIVAMAIGIILIVVGMVVEFQA